MLDCFEYLIVLLYHPQLIFSFIHIFLNVLYLFLFMEHWHGRLSQPYRDPLKVTRPRHIPMFDWMSFDNVLLDLDPTILLPAPGSTVLHSIHIHSINSRRLVPIDWTCGHSYSNEKNLFKFWSTVRIRVQNVFTILIGLNDSEFVERPYFFCLFFFRNNKSALRILWGKAGHPIPRLEVV